MTTTDSSTPTLFALFPLGETRPIWATVTTREDANERATYAAVSHGNVELLDGTDLTARLAEGHAEWRADGPAETGGTVGGDGAGESLSIRYRREDKPGSMITVYAYDVDRVLRNWQAEDDDSPRWDVEVMVEYMVCTDPSDPGMSEVWSDYTYDSDVYPTSFATEAEAAGKREAALRMHGPRGFTWDGDPR